MAERIRTPEEEGLLMVRWMSRRDKETRWRRCCWPGSTGSATMGCRSGATGAQAVCCHIALNRLHAGHCSGLVLVIGHPMETAVEVGDDLEL